MPTLELKIERLEKLVGKKLLLKDLEYDLQWISLDLEEINKKEQKIKVEYNPNRPDFSSPEGIARALKGYYELELGLPSFEVTPGKIQMNVDSTVKEIRPYIVCGVVKDIDLDEDEVTTLMNIQEQLHWAVGRDRKKVAIGVHDLDKIVPPFRYLAVKPDSINFLPLQGDGSTMNLNEILKYHEKGIKYAHILENNELYPILLDNKDEVISFPPIINGILTTVSNDTKNLFLEMTGTDLKSVNLALNILSTTLYDMGAKIESVQVIYNKDEKYITPNLEPKKWEISTKYINDYLGLNLSITDMIKCFEKVRMNAKRSSKKDYIDIWVPAFRGDIMHPVDFTEDCAIGYGYFNLPKIIKEGCIGEYHPIQKFSNKIRTIMIGGGYIEVLNFILANVTKQYDYMKRQNKSNEIIQIANPISEEYNTTRTNILPKLMETLLFNRSEEKPIKIFEVGDVIILDPKEDTGAKRELHLSAVTYHEDADYTEIKSTLDFIMNTLGCSNEIDIKVSNNPSYLSGRSGDIYLGKKKIGEIGEINPEVLLNFKLEFPAAALELNLQNFF
ncbi:MAG: phenylalanine--tRNA ligase subunit beta [Candidatus Lokiarchaeota archaeon]|nr:phenylalanine--tRNA ligase subunit beta [Candidatus Lokiarchaeota archaeon]